MKKCFVNVWTGCASNTLIILWGQKVVGPIRSKRYLTRSLVVIQAQTYSWSPGSYFHLDWCPLPFFVSLEDSWRVFASSWPAVQPFEMLSYLKNIAKDTTDRELSVLAQTSCKQLEQDRSIIMCCQPRKGGVKILPSCQRQHQQQLTPVLSKHLQQPE